MIDGKMECCSYEFVIIYYYVFYYGIFLINIYYFNEIFLYVLSMIIF